MVDGLFISVVGMAAVFVILTIMMLLMTGLDKFFSAEEVDDDISNKSDKDNQEDIMELTAIAVAVNLYRKRKKARLQAESAFSIKYRLIKELVQVRFRTERKALAPIRAFVGTNGRANKKLFS